MNRIIEDLYAEKLSEVFADAGKGISIQDSNDTDR